MSASEGDTPSLDVSLSAGNTSNPQSVESLTFSGGQSQSYKNKDNREMYHNYRIRKNINYFEGVHCSKNSLKQGICWT